MIKFLIAIFFIMEFIIAFVLIVKIYKFNKVINSLNEKVLVSRVQIKSFFLDFKVLMEELNDGIIKLQEFIRIKRQESLFQILKMTFIYTCIIMLKGKYRRTILAYQIGRGIVEGILET